jgi:tRNA U38,U39,U40 pseudouridine synthase TruA
MTSNEKYSGRKKEFLFQDKYAWNVRPLNIEAMKAAAKHLIGIHDFSAIRNSGCQSLSPYRHIIQLDIECDNDMPFLNTTDKHRLNQSFLLVSIFMMWDTDMTIDYCIVYILVYKITYINIHNIHTQFSFLIFLFYLYILGKL